MILEERIPSVVRDYIGMGEVLNKTFHKADDFPESEAAVFPHCVRDYFLKTLIHYLFFSNELLTIEKFVRDINDVFKITEKLLEDSNT